MASKYDTDLLGSIPLTASIREFTDVGKPTVVAESESPMAQAYRMASLKMLANLSEAQRDYKNLFPNIVVENT